MWSATTRDSSSLSSPARSAIPPMTYHKGRGSAHLLVSGTKRFRTWVRVSGEGPDDLLDSGNVRQREAHTKFRASGPGHQCLVNTNGLIGSRDDQGKRKRHPGGYLRRTFNMKMVLGEAPHRSCNVPVLMREADHAGDRYR